MIKRILKISLGIIFFSVAIGVSIALYEQLGNIHNLSQNQLYFLLGVGSYIVLHLVFWKPVYLYILGHELTHAISAWICGGRVRFAKVSSKGGTLWTTKSNFFISLSPYFFPIYTVLLSLLYFVISLFHNLDVYIPYFIALIGFSLAFHLVLTIDFLKKGQSDILKTGYLFSISLVYIVNIIVLVFVLSRIFPDISFADFLKSSCLIVKSLYLSVFKQLF